MNRTQKEQFVEEIRGKFADAPLVILTDFKGSSVSQLEELRRACDPIGVRFQVVKNTLCRRALSGTPKEGLIEAFQGNVGVVFAGEDPIAAAKVFRDQAKTNKNLAVKAGYFEGDILDEAGVVAVASLPSKEELLSLLLRTVQEPPRRILGILQAPARDLLYLLRNYENKLEETP